VRLTLAVGALVAFLSLPYAVLRPLLSSGSARALGLIGALSLVGVAASVVAVLGVVVAPEPLPVAALGAAIDACIAGVARLLSHPLEHWPSIFAAAVLAALAARLVIAAVRTTLDARRARPPRERLPGEDEIARVLLGARLDGVRLLVSDVPVAYTSGLLRPQTVVSTGLLQALDDGQRFAVIAHERSHAKRRHVALLFLAIVLKRAYAFVPGIGLAVEYLALGLKRPQTTMPSAPSVIPSSWHGPSRRRPG
jgi:Zn-dependent protease with chaperone function